MRPNSKDQPNDKQTVRYNCRRRRGYQLKRVKNESSDVIEQRLVSPDDVPSTVNEDIIHVRMLWIGEGVLPRNMLEYAEDAIDVTEGGLQVCVPLVILGSHGRTPFGDRLEYDHIGFVASVLALDCEVEGHGAEVSLAT